MKCDQYNGLTLAYIGDSVFELYMRTYILEKGFTKVNNLHNEVVKYTSGENQANFIFYLLNNNLLTQDEITIYKRGRNANIKTNHKNLALYLEATGFEALIGYLYLSEQKNRLMELINIIKSI